MVDGRVGVTSDDEYVARPILSGSLEIALSDVVNFEEEIAKLEKQAKAEKQPKKKFEIVQQIQKLKKEL